jgi:hypothetical protein
MTFPVVVKEIVEGGFREIQRSRPAAVDSANLTGGITRYGTPTERQDHSWACPQSVRRLRYARITT